MKQLALRVLGGVTSTICLAALIGCESSVNQDHSASANDNWPVINSTVAKDEATEKAVAELLAKMTLEQKVGQMIQGEIKAVTPEDVKKYHLGSVLNGGGSFPDANKYATVNDWVTLADAYYNASMDTSDGGLAIPITWGTDAMHGHSNVIGATLFPHNIGLGAARNPELISRIGEATAKEVLVTGIDWAFAPTVAVVRDDRWGRTYEGYSEDPEVVKAYAGKMIEGLQGIGGTDEAFDENHLVATAKHFIGDGGTEKGDDQGDNISSEQELLDIHAQGYVSALAAGAQTVMASFNSWQGKKSHGSYYLMTEVLKNRMGFDGFIVGDWNGHGQVAGCTNVSCPQAINAGLDMFMVPEDWKALLKNTIAEVRSGVIPMSRVDDAVTRILRVKMRSGLFEMGAPSERTYANRTEVFGAAEHRELARQAVRESLVLLKNQNQLLPLDRSLNVLVAGDGADNIGKQTGGWTLSWQGTGNSNSDFPGATSIYAGINEVVTEAGGKAVLSVDGSIDAATFKTKPDVAIVVFGEEPYAEGVGDLDNLEYQYGNKNDLAILKKLEAQGIPVVSVFLSGRPLWVNKELNASDAFVVAWLPGSEGAGVADLLFKDSSGEIAHDFTGKLSFSWPLDNSAKPLNRNDSEYNPLFAYDFGLTYTDVDSLADNLDEESVWIAEAASKSLQIFAGKPQSPWALYLGNSASWQKPVNSSSVSTEGSANVSITTIDKVVQEDSRRITWAGKETGQVFLKDESQLHDLTDMLAKNSTLTLDLRVDTKPTASVLARMDCGYPCEGTLAIDENLSTLTVGQWSSLSIDLQCFADAGADLSKIDTPLALVTDGELTLSFSNISIVPETAQQADIQCQPSESDVATTAQLNNG